MQQYFVKGTCQLHQAIVLDEEQAHHIQKVLRMHSGELIRLVDETNHVFLSEVHCSSTGVSAVAIKELPPVKPKVNITLALALIKGERWDYAIQKCCELGVGTIQPLITSRCVVKIKEDALDKKLKRWNKIALEACEQCKRSDLVEVLAPCTLQELNDSSSELKLLAYEQADHTSDQIKQLVNAYPDVTDILCVIGPEGGFSQEEANQLLQQGFLCTSLGHRILRAETAALAIVNTLSMLYES